MQKSPSNILSLFSLAKLPPSHKQAFDLQYNQASIPYLRLTTYIVIVYSMPYYYLDYVSAPQNYKLIWLVRTIGIVLPTIVLYFLSFGKKFVKKYQLYATLYVLWTSLSIEAMLYVCNPDEICTKTYFLGILILNSLSILTRLRLKNAVLVYLISFVGFIILIFAKQHLDKDLPLLLNRLLLYFSMLTTLTVSHFFIEDNRIKIFLNEINLREKNSELEMQNATIQSQKAELEAQNDQLALQKKTLENYNRKLQDSINYARKIQMALLPDRDLLTKYLADWAIYYSPKETVSGDFYHWQLKDNKLVIAVADSTGHGVPGAFMSVLLIGQLKDLIEKSKELNPALILKDLRNSVIKTLKQDHSTPISDGCDISLMIYDPEKKEFTFSGANMHGLWITRKIELPENTKFIGTDKGFSLIQLSATSQPISFYKKMRDFHLVTIPVSPGDKVILFSDGVIDQFNSKYRKLTSKRFKKFVLENAGQSPTEFIETFKNFFEHWKDGVHQTDDVSLLILQI